MRSVLRPTTERDGPELISFLLRARSESLPSESTRPDLLYWKFWAAREDYVEPRSYVLERNGRIIAHAGIWPMVLRTTTGTYRGCHLFDWAADPNVLGAGVAIIQRIYRLFDFLYAIGGAKITQKIIPAIGFEKIGEAWSGARPLRPLRQMLSHQYADWRIPARFVRNALWSLIPAKTKVKGWALSDRFNEALCPSLLLENVPTAAHSDAFFRYLKHCPTAEIKTFELEKEGHFVGRIVLSFLHNQVRIVGVWLNHPTSDGLCAAYRLAQDAAGSMAEAFEVVCSGSSLVSETAAIAAGLRIRGRTPIYVLCARQSPIPASFEFQIADNDAVFQSDGGPSYWT